MDQPHAKDMPVRHMDSICLRFCPQCQLTRSGGLPLNVEFSAGQQLITSEDSSLLRLIAKHAGRWETFSISGPTSLYTELHACTREPFALLRVLAVEMQYGHVDGQDDGVEVDEDGDVPILRTFKDAPRLQQIAANKTHWPMPLSLELPWSQLLRFRGSNKWGGHLDALRSATNLVDCALMIPSPQGTPSVPATLIMLPHLFRLYLAEPVFLQCLETPRNLQKLVIYRPPEVYQNGVGFVAGESPDLMLMLEAATTITDLGLMFSLPDAFARDFSDYLSVVPALQRFTTHHFIAETRQSDFMHAIQNDFMHAVESRWQHGRLRSVTTSNGGFLSPTILDRIERLRSQGMEFVVARATEVRDQMAPPF
ncbi:hypothetical protein K438DRAFT_1890614 [Mycena galopus ATCC 62051]|nr:hypothetical protein K438DRAFT_1890614 [Mycena galopus ATCC 62051]